MVVDSVLDWLLVVPAEGRAADARPSLISLRQQRSSQAVQHSPDLDDAIDELSGDYTIEHAEIVGLREMMFDLARRADGHRDESREILT
jgi:hypothetical protein